MQLLTPTLSRRARSSGLLGPLLSRFQHTQVPSSGTHSLQPQLHRPLSQPTYYSHPFLMTAAEVTPAITRSEYVSRRRNLATLLPPNSLSIFPSNPQLYMTEDVPYLYHHNTDLYYISGVVEPSACLIAFRPADAADTQYTLFVTDRDPSKELWDGPFCGPSDDVREYFAVNDVLPTTSLPSFVTDHLPILDSFHFDSSINPQLIALLSQLETPQRERLVSRWRQGTPPKTFLLPLRLQKSSAEIGLLRKGASIIAHALNDAMAAYRATDDFRIPERAIDAVIEYECKRRGATRMAFPSVVASGANATILHYMRNDSRAVSGDFVMVDAGCEVHGYCSDVSRSWPVSGTFSSPQRELYHLVLETHQRCIEISREGCVVDGSVVSMDHLHLISTRMLTDGLLQLGFLKGHSLESALATGAYSTYFPHSIGHYLGMDVHDTHRLSKSLPLRRNMVITIEPGLYCRPDDEEVPKAFRGIGMRVEDDVVVGNSTTSPDVLSADAVRDLDEIEALVGSRPR